MLARADHRLKLLGSLALNFTTHFLAEISLPATNHLHRRIAATEIQKNTTDSMTLVTSRALPKFESYRMLETAAFPGSKAKYAIERFHGIDRLGSFRPCPFREASANHADDVVHLTINALDRLTGAMTVLANHSDLSLQFRLKGVQTSILSGVPTAVSWDRVHRVLHPLSRA